MLVPLGKPVVGEQGRGGDFALFFIKREVVLPSYF
jgi:hypothetical protein